MGADIQPADRVIWKPQPRQAEAIACPAFELFFGGAKGGGKSDFLLGDWFSGVAEWGEAWKGILFRRSYKELDELIGRSRQIYDRIPGAIYVGGDQMLWRIPAPRAKYPGTATLRFRALESDLDVGKYNGHQYPWIGFDELTEFPTSGPYMFMIGCCRSAMGAPASMRSTGNPGRPGHVWVKGRFIDVARPFELYRDKVKQEDGTIVEVTRCFIPSKLEDNLILMQNDPQYGNRLLLQAPHLIQALRYGNWDVVVGQVLSEYSRERHVIRRQPLAQSWYRFLSMDWGYAKPFSIGWWAVNDDGRMIRYKEWYGNETGAENTGIRMSASAVARKAWDMSVDEGATVMVADPACWTKQGLSSQAGEDVPSIAETFEAAGFEMVKANNDRLAGLQQLHERLQSIGHDGRPMLLIMDNCNDWMRTVPYLTADPRNPEDINTELEDHCFPDGTMIATPGGPRPIERIKRGDRVITRDGPRKIVDIWHEGEHPTVVARFSNGRQLEATSAHKMWVQGRGFVRIDEMRYGDIVMFREEPWRKLAPTTASCSDDTPNQNEQRIAATSSLPRRIAGAVLRLFIGRSGNGSADQSRTAGRSTIKTETPGTTPSRTSNASRQRNTSDTITSGRYTTPREAAPRLPHGTEAAPEKPGIPSEAGRIGRGGSPQSAPARCAERSTGAEPWANRSTAPSDAKPVHFVGITPSTTKAVHDLSVERTHEYFADGFLVSNCYDDTRYGVMSEYGKNPRALRKRPIFQATRERGRKKDYDPLHHGL